MNKTSGIILLLFALPGVHLQIINHCYATTICNTDMKVAKIISQFWHKTTEDGCEADIHSLFEMRKKLQEDQMENYHYDLFKELLSAHINSSLMESLFNQIMATISTKSSINVRGQDFEQIINDLYREDRKFILKIWQQVLDKAAAIMAMPGIIQHILLNETNKELKLDLLHYLLQKYENQQPIDQHTMPALAYAITTVAEEISNGDYKPKAYETSKRIINTKIPKPLATLYLAQGFYNVSLLNRQHKKFIFPDADAGAADNKRFIVTLISQLKYNVKGVFKVETNAEGMLAFGAFYKPSYQYIVAEAHSAFICLDCALNGSQWWQVLWPLENKELLAFQNTLTGELLCATNLYKENWILISTLAAEKNGNNSACHWEVSMNIKGL